MLYVAYHITVQVIAHLYALPLLMQLSRLYPLRRLKSLLHVHELVSFYQTQV